MQMSELFEKCLSTEYTHSEQSGDYAFALNGNTMYLFFQWSNGKRDWLNNFYFIPKRVSGVGVNWLCHRGYLRVWEAIKPSVSEFLEKHAKRIKNVVVVGYSHGAAVATIAYDWIWYNYPHLRENLCGYGFGCPRVYFGFMSKDMKKRFANFHPVRCAQDIVTHCPFAIMGFRHVNKVIRVGKRFDYGPFRSHYPESYSKALKESELTESNTNIN